MTAAGWLRRASLALAIAALAGTLSSAGAAAAPAWRLDAISNSTVTPGGTTVLLAEATNVGDEATDGSEVVITAVLPAGFTVVDAVVDVPTSSFGSITFPCTAGDGVSPVAGASDVQCVNTSTIPRFGSGNNFEYLTLTIAADAGVDGTLTTAYSVAGGGADMVSTVDPTVVVDAGSVPAFGIDAFDAQFSTRRRPLTQAGAHPDAASYGVRLRHGNQSVRAGPLRPVEPVKDVVVDLPPGFVGDPTRRRHVHRCAARERRSGPVRAAAVPVDLAGRDDVVRMNTPARRTSSMPFGAVPVYNMVPPPDAPARFGFNVARQRRRRSTRACAAGATTASRSDARDISEGLALIGTTFDASGACLRTPPRRRARVPGTERAVARRARHAERRAARARSCATRRSALRPASACLTTVRVDSWFHPGDFRTATLG